MIDNILISLSFVFLARNMNSNEINDLTFKSDRLLEAANFDAAARDYVDDAHTERVYLSSPAGMLGVALFHAPDAPSRTAGRTRVLLTLPDQLGSPAFIVDRETSEVVERPTFEAQAAAESDFRPDRWGNFRSQYRHSGPPRRQRGWPYLFRRSLLRADARALDQPRSIENPCDGRGSESLRLRGGFSLALR